MRLAEITLCVLLAEHPQPALGDALWDWYYGPGCCDCSEVIATALQAVAVAHRLPIASADAWEIEMWFANHPQYDRQVAKQTRTMAATCRPD
jgi:hypothetical protein